MLKCLRILGALKWYVAQSFEMFCREACFSGGDFHNKMKKESYTQTFTSPIKNNGQVRTQFKRLVWQQEVMREHYATCSGSCCSLVQWWSFFSFQWLHEQINFCYWSEKTFAWYKNDFRTSSNWLCYALLMMLASWVLISLMVVV